jgi:hypothetical protein
LQRRSVAIDLVDKHATEGRRPSRVRINPLTSNCKCSLARVTAKILHRTIARHDERRLLSHCHIRSAKALIRRIPPGCRFRAGPVFASGRRV